jgi:flagellar biosynthesis/type III secretory pathway M-ring protein FliF/YscJ
LGVASFKYLLFADSLLSKKKEASFPPYAIAIIVALILLLLVALVSFLVFRRRRHSQPDVDNTVAVNDVATEASQRKDFSLSICCI